MWLVTASADFSKLVPDRSPFKKWQFFSIFWLTSFLKLKLISAFITKLSKSYYKVGLVYITMCTKMSGRVEQVLQNWYYIFCYKIGQCYKSWQLLLHSWAGIKKWCSYYKVERYNWSQYFEFWCNLYFEL